MCRIGGCQRWPRAPTTASAKAGLCALPSGPAKRNGSAHQRTGGRAIRRVDRQTRTGRNRRSMVEPSRLGQGSGAKGAGLLLGLAEMCQDEQGACLSPTRCGAGGGRPRRSGRDGLQSECCLSIERGQGGRRGGLACHRALEPPMAYRITSIQRRGQRIALARGLAQPTSRPGRHRAGRGQIATDACVLRNARFSTILDTGFGTIKMQMSAETLERWLREEGLLE